ncbi:TPR-like protein [Mycena maculata]|uniref:TPR-like protein n=1 Tax=Mycena maculata TaxID=230809 RepID=A0AAD7KBX2_9AGAR|nr:TPR-like protein [Mycena maculata]
MFKPGDKLNPYDPAALDLPGDEGVQRRLQAGSSPMSPAMAEMINNPETRQSTLDALLQMMRADAAERERTGETASEQTKREKREWAEADAKSAALKIRGNEAFKNGEYKTAYVIYTACAYLTPQEPLYSLNRSAVALKLKLYTEASEDASDAIRKGDFNRAKAHFRRGQAMFFVGAWAKAERDYTEALALQPGDGNVVSQMAELNRLRGLSSDDQAVWISAQAPVTLGDIFEAGELKRQAEEVMGCSMD